MRLDPRPQFPGFFVQSWITESHVSRACVAGADREVRKNCSRAVSGSGVNGLGGIVPAASFAAARNQTKYPSRLASPILASGCQCVRCDSQWHSPLTRRMLAKCTLPPPQTRIARGRCEASYEKWHGEDRTPVGQSRVTARSPAATTRPASGLCSGDDDRSASAASAMQPAMIASSIRPVLRWGADCEFEGIECAPSPILA